MLQGESKVMSQLSNGVYEEYQCFDTENKIKPRRYCIGGLFSPAVRKSCTKVSKAECFDIEKPINDVAYT